MLFDIILTHPKNPAPCFLCTFLWFQTLIVTESDFPIKLNQLKCLQQKERKKNETIKDK